MAEHKADDQEPAPIDGQQGAGLRVTLMGSGAILGEVIKAAEQLAQRGIASDVVSVTSWSELARDGRRSEERTLRGESAEQPYLAQLLGGCSGPIIAATDYVRLVPESVRAYLPSDRRYVTLGTDGFGRSDTRSELRRFFGVDVQNIVDVASQLLNQEQPTPG